MAKEKFRLEESGTTRIEILRETGKRTDKQGEIIIRSGEENIEIYALAPLTAVLNALLRASTFLEPPSD